MSSQEIQIVKERSRINEEIEMAKRKITETTEAIDPAQLEQKK